MTTKQKLGQFFTTNYEYIFQGMKIPENTKTVVEPFAGNCDLLPFIKKFSDTVECYDICVQSEKDFVIQRDTLKDPPVYTGKYLITNPPFLARNKSTDKFYFDKYGVNDLYKCLIKEILTNKCDGGILITPLNFWSSIRISDILLRKSFLEEYSILLLNIFEEQVFDDTSYTVCSFQFEPKKNSLSVFKTVIFPSKKIIHLDLNDSCNYTPGGCIYNLNTCDSKTLVSRLTSKNIDNKNTFILVKCIDDSSENKIQMSFVEKSDLYIDLTPNQTARTYMSLVIEPELSFEAQKELVKEFNKFLNEYREKFNSLFLANYRESKDIARKRISFSLVYIITKFILKNA